MGAYSAGRQDVKPIGAFLALIVLVAGASACDQGADGTLAGCSAAYVGTYDGASKGEMLVSIDSGGTFLCFFYPDGVGDVETFLSGEGTISDTGLLAGTSNGLALDCQVDLDTCSCSGTWTQDRGSNFEKTGTFEMHMRQQ
jgi:hypothetical protein